MIVRGPSLCWGSYSLLEYALHGFSFPLLHVLFVLFLLVFSFVLCSFFHSHPFFLFVFNGTLGPFVCSLIPGFTDALGKVKCNNVTRGPNSVEMIKVEKMKIKIEFKIFFYIVLK